MIASVKFCSIGHFLIKMNNYVLNHFSVATNSLDNTAQMVLTMFLRGWRQHAITN